MTTNPYPVDSATRPCCGAIGTHTPDCRPAGAVHVNEWTDFGEERFRCFAGPIREIPEIPFNDGPANVSIDGTQLFDGTVEHRCIRLTGIGWEDQLTSEVARKLATALLGAADDLDRLDGPR
ncbi:hypothetical protein [Mycobacterium sp. IDR2000157661]|uniref:hypothetical protein n=1 Tax=Mycobacterium sp. IDR2000157661 TaxID=2867005 RepID=UPI001EEC4209|nr:hypothetical protein [Mycobacterium sp. IDR2000157661]ULE32868.1 hypothetical protein K3G64_22815 [Mycobacterium sp. IDR2000157661]